MFNCSYAHIKYIQLGMRLYDYDIYLILLTMFYCFYSLYEYRHTEPSRTFQETRKLHGYRGISEDTADRLC